MQKMRLTTTSLVFFMTNFHRTLHNTSNRILINLNMETKPLKGLSNMLAPSRKLYRIQSSLSECYYKFWWGWTRMAGSFIIRRESSLLSTRCHRSWSFITTQVALHLLCASITSNSTKSSATTSLTIFQSRQSGAPPIPFSQNFWVSNSFTITQLTPKTHIVKVEKFLPNSRRHFHKHEQDPPGHFQSV